MSQGRGAAVAAVVVFAMAACGSNDEGESTPATEASTSATTPPATVPTTTTIAPTTTTAATTPTTASPPTTAPTDGPAVAVLPAEGGMVEVTPSGVWVFPHRDPLGVRVDPATMSIDLQIDLPAYANDSVLADGLIWLSTETDGGSLTAIDPETGAVVARIPDVYAGTPVAAFGRVWAPSLAEDGTLLRTDPATLTVERWQGQSAGGFSLVAGTDRLWTLGLADGLVGIDPVTGERTEPWRPLTILGEPPTNMRATSRGTLLLPTSTGVNEVDPVGRTVVATIAYPPGLVALGPVDPGAGSLDRPTFMFGDADDRDPPRGETPEVVIATVDVESEALVDAVTTRWTEGARIDGRVLWLSPLRTPELERIPLPDP